jgi:hypothetical protein
MAEFETRMARVEAANHTVRNMLEKFAAEVCEKLELAGKESKSEDGARKMDADFVTPLELFRLVPMSHGHETEPDPCQGTILDMFDDYDD